MKRRSFLKIGLLSITSIYCFPEIFFNLLRKKPSLKTESDKNKFLFRGRHSGEIINGKVLMPESFMPILMGRKMHLLALESKGYLQLIPADISLNKKIHKHITELILMEPNMQFSRWGRSTIKSDGSLFIPAKMRKLANILNREVVIVGMLRLIEIWDKNFWHEEFEKCKTEFRIMCQNELNLTELAR